MDMDQTNTWSNVAPVKAKKALDHVPQRPGLYKLTFKVFDNVYIYIGEANDLQRRIREYASNPTEGNYKEYLLFDLLNEVGEAELSICCDDGLQTAEARRKREKIAIDDTVRQGLRCLNRGQTNDIAMQRFQLKSKEKVLQNELERIRAKLAALPQP